MRTECARQHARRPTSERSLFSVNGTSTESSLTFRRCTWRTKDAGRKTSHGKEPCRRDRQQHTREGRQRSDLCFRQYRPQRKHGSGEEQAERETARGRASNDDELAPSQSSRKAQPKPDSDANGDEGADWPSDKRTRRHRPRAALDGVHHSAAVDEGEEQQNDLLRDAEDMLEMPR